MAKRAAGWNVRKRNGVRALVRHAHATASWRAECSTAEPDSPAAAPAPQPTHNGDWDAALQPVHEADFLPRPLRQRGGHNVGRGADEGAVAAKAGAKVERPGQDLGGKGAESVRDWLVRMQGRVGGGSGGRCRCYLPCCTSACNMPRLTLISRPSPALARYSMTGTAGRKGTAGEAVVQTNQRHSELRHSRRRAWHPQTARSGRGQYLVSCGYRALHAQLGAKCCTRSPQ